MAEKNTSKNQQFLQQFERQRLNKPCNRIIDLRGKVAGECQAYTFGGKTHYLDDRAYLLAKQLLDRFNNRYTFGVYESLLKALKSLPTTSPSSSNDKDNKTLLSRDKNHVQLLPFDQQLQRKEPRIIFASPVEIRIADVLYHGTTMDITTSSISVSLKRTYTLDQDDEISVSFIELASEPLLLSKVPYKILRINHDERRTQLILIRKRQDNNAVSQCLDTWSQLHNSAEYLDLNNELFNLATHYYLRLYCCSLTSSLFWLSNNDDVDSIKAFHQSDIAQEALQSLCQQNQNVDFSFLPFEQIMTERCDFLLLISTQETPKHYIARRDDSRAIAHLFNWHSHQHNSQILLLQNCDKSISLEDFEPEINLVADTDLDYAHSLKQRLADISLLATVTNISNSCQHFDHIIPSDEPQLMQQHWQGHIPQPTSFQHHIQRNNQRFSIRTNIHLQLSDYDEIFEITTTDVSEEGLSFSLPRHISLKVGSRVKIDFVRWQSQTKKVKLKELPYIVRNNQFHSGISHFGLEREIYACPQNINTFFATTIEHNKEKLIENNADVFISQETKIFTSLLGLHLTAIPFYLAIDSDNQRIVQAVSTGARNNANNEQLWQTMQRQVTAMSRVLNELPDTQDSSISFGLYSYQDTMGSWHIQADYALETSAQKSMFINQALRNEHYLFYHCSLIPIKPALLKQEEDLNQQLSQLRPHSPHKVKQIRETLHSLFAVGELIDISDIIKANYQ